MDFRTINMMVPLLQEEDYCCNSLSCQTIHSNNSISTTTTTTQRTHDRERHLSFTKENKNSNNTKSTSLTRRRKRSMMVVSQQTPKNESSLLSRDSTILEEPRISSTINRRRRRRPRTQQQPGSMTSRLLFPLLQVVILSIFSRIEEAAAESSSSSSSSLSYLEECKRSLSSFDDNNDDFLSRLEYSRAIAHVSDGTFDANYSKLPWYMKETFDNFAKVPCRSDRCIDLGDDDSIADFCADVELAVSTATTTYSAITTTTQQQQQQRKWQDTQLLPSLSPTLPIPMPSTGFSHSVDRSPNPYVTTPTVHHYHDIPRTSSSSHQKRKLELTQQCRIALSVGDSNRDDQLNQAEYVRYVNQLSRQQFPGASFTSLPQPFQQSYDNFAINGQIPVAGSKPGQTPTDFQMTFLNDLCSETQDILSNPPPPSQQPPSPGPPTPPSGGGDCSATIGRPQCNTALAIADLSRDNLLNQVEYVRFVNRLSGNTYAGDAFSDLPGNIQDNFNNFARTNGQVDINGSKPGQTPTSDQDVFLGELCCLTDLAVDNPGMPTTPTPPSGSPPTTGPPPTLECEDTISRLQCNTAIAIADISRDNLVDQVEYVRFVNRLSGNEYAGVDFVDLPGNFIDNYNKFATTQGQIDVDGAKPGQSPTAEQNEFLNALCCETDLVVQNPGDGGGEPTPQPPTPTPPSGGGTLPPTFLPLLCKTAMASSDLNRDDLLNEAEYVRFLNRLTRNEFIGLDFEELDQRLQENFNTLATTDGQIGIFGSKPGQSPNDEQEEAIEEICVDTAIALNPAAPSPTPAPGGGPTTIAPVAPPTPSPDDGTGPTLPPTFLDALCRTAIASSDFNRDSYLNEEEYVRALNRLTRNEFLGVAFEDLEVPMPQVYESLASEENGQIFIFGAKPGENADPEQEQFILDICLEISIGLSRLGETFAPTAPTAAPSISEPTDPGPVPPTFAPGSSEVYNSFILSNAGGIKAENLQEGRNREGLDRAYASFSSNAVDIIKAAQRRLNNGSMLRRRKLVVNFVPSSPDIYILIDSECPEGLPAISSCQTAFANFRLEIDDEDPYDISDFYTAETQRLIAENFLQIALTDTDPQSILRIVNASFPVTSTFPPSEAPGETEPPVEDDDFFEFIDDVPVGAIVGGVVGGCVFFVIVGLLSSNERVIAFCDRSKGKATGIRDDDDDYGGRGDKDDDDASVDDQKENGFGGNDNAFGDKPEKDKKGLFGKKNKQGSDKNLGGDDNDFGFGVPPPNNRDEDDNQDFANYGFDDPSDADDNKKDGSGKGGEDNVFGDTPESPGWGNSGDGAGGFFGNAGSGWGANETSSAADNFFATSAFGDAAEGDDGSGSESGSGSDSYTSSDDSTYESDEVDNDDTEGDGTTEDFEDDDSYSHSSADDDASSASGSSGSMGSSLQRQSNEMDAMIDEGNWDGIAAAANSFNVREGSSLEGSSKRSSAKGSFDETDEGDEDSYSGSESHSESASGSETTATTTTEMREKRVEFRAQVEALVRLVMPDEIEKVDKMMDQFQGREAELVSTLQTMQERSATQRARAAVHKSKTRPERADGQFRADGLLAAAGGTEGSAAGTAAIAAASLPIPAATMMGEDSQGGDDMGFGDRDAFGADNMEGSYDDEDGSRSYYSGDEDGSRSYYSGEDSRSGSRSYYSGEEGSQSYISGEDSYRSGEGSQSYISGEGSYRSGEGSQSYISGEGSGSYRSGEGSRSYRSGEGSQSYISGEGSQSYISGEGSQSYISGEGGSQSYVSGQGGSQSFISGETGSQSFISGETGSQSYVSGEGSQSYISGEGSQSYVSGEGSYRSGDGSRSYYSGEDSRGSQSRSNYSGEEGSYYSGEEEGSYYSGDEDGEEGDWED